MNRKELFLIFSVMHLLCIVMYTNLQVTTTKALIPSIVSVNSRNVGSATWVEITITHDPPPPIGAAHYVSNIQLEINETTVNLTQEPQSTTTFTIQHSLGPNADSYSITARALCNLHGYSSRSNPLTIPAFTLEEKVATPTFNPPGGTYSTSQSVAVNCATPNATIRYTLSGEEPTSSYPVYSTPIQLTIGTISTVIKAKAFEGGMTDSDTAQATYTIRKEETAQEPLLLYATITIVAILTFTAVGVLYWKKRTSIKNPN